ncbi:DEAD/DEAH box helicase [Taklimakanibacter deserti]|uniref:DEAD/DEAH box helicase n=1 Tax=Taklimakanibacter deserti TaxID=2267839 RepID=UPI000E64E4C1
MTIALRDYQADAIARIERDPNRRVLLVCPTGGGKTVIATAIMKEFSDQWKKALFVVHRREIVQQTSRKLQDLRISHGIIMAGVRDRPLDRVQVAAIQTLHARAIRSDRMALPEADLVIIDEAHHASAATYKAVIEAYPNARIVGLTATPCRGDGRGLGGIFESMLEVEQVQGLIDKGHLVRTKVFAPKAPPDLKGVKVRMGDYVEGQLAERMNTDKLVGDIVTHWHRHGEKRKTVVFAVNVAHSIHIRNEFIKSGVRCGHIDGSTPKPERDQTLERLRRGDIDVVTNCAVLTEGWDMPDVGCCVLARPTRQMGLYRQMIGRALRSAPGKTDAIVLDHAGATHRLGFAEDPVEWTLDRGKGARNTAQERREANLGPRAVMECAQCGVMREGGKACWNCGFLPQRKPADYRVADGDLGLIDRQRRVQPIVLQQAAKDQFLGELLWYATERGYKRGWAAHKFKERFGHWPPYGNPPPAKPSPETLSWIRSRNIAWAKAKGGTAA